MKAGSRDGCFTCEEREGKHWRIQERCSVWLYPGEMDAWTDRSRKEQRTD